MRVLRSRARVVWRTSGSEGGLRSCLRRKSITAWNKALASSLNFFCFRALAPPPIGLNMITTTLQGRARFVQLKSQHGCKRERRGVCTFPFCDVILWTFGWCSRHSISMVCTYVLVCRLGMNAKRPSQRASEGRKRTLLPPKTTKLLVCEA